MTSVRDRLRADVSGGAFALADVDPGGTPGLRDKAAARDAVAAAQPALATAQEQLYAERTRSLLLVLQGMDAAGKDGAVRNVVGAFHPAGVLVTSFRAPTDEERKHDFLWRIQRALPAPGIVGVFNRSHYEDVGIVRVHGWAPPEEIERRYAAINSFEAQLAAEGTTVVKCFLHISYDEQRERLLARLDDPAKRWKFQEHDLDERDQWAAYMSAYETAITRCTSDAAPWHVIPADRKWYRDWAVANILLETFAEMGVHYPDPPLDLPALRARLNAS